MLAYCGRFIRTACLFILGVLLFPFVLLSGWDDSYCEGELEAYFSRGCAGLSLVIGLSMLVVPGALLATYTPLQGYRAFLAGLLLLVALLGIGMLGLVWVDRRREQRKAIKLLADCTYRSCGAPVGGVSRGKIDVLHSIGVSPERVTATPEWRIECPACDRPSCFGDNGEPMDCESDGFVTEIVRSF